MKLCPERGRMLNGTYEPELNKLKVLFGIYTFFIIASIIMPQYFGIHIVYDITCARFANILFIIYICANPKILTHFAQTALRCEIFYPLCLYLMVAGYTMILRRNINAFFMVFLEVFSLFMMVYGIRYVIGYRRAIKWILGCAYFLGIYGLIEFVLEKSLFLEFFATLPTQVADGFRSGYYRIKGPCGHALGYGLVLLLFIAIACIDLDRNEVYVFKRPGLLILLYVNALLTGSRSTLGIAVLEFAVLFLFSRRNIVKKTLFYLCIGGMIAIGLLLVCYRTSMCQYLLGQLTSVIDSFFDTNYAVNFGVEVERLKNSEEYREVLPQIFTLPWLSPLLGQGKSIDGTVINGLYVQSIDNYYVMQYIKYAYPGLVAYGLFFVSLLVAFWRSLRREKQNNPVVTKVVLVGCVHYFLNLWWVDALQTLKYVYIVIAIFYAARFEEQDRRKNGEVNQNDRKKEND